MATTQAQALAVATDGESRMPQALLGTWLLRGIVEIDATCTITAEPYGPHPSGQLIYGPGGAMAVVIREHGDLPAVAYAGEAVRAEGNLLRHVVRVGLPPYTEDQVRHARLDNETDLVLATGAEGQPRVELRWRRA
jgi:hypothetical protein